MAISNEIIERYQSRYYAFSDQCDIISDTGKWDEDENGEMLSYFYNEFTSIVIRLSSADGNITEEELGVLRDVFNIEYTKEEFSDLYASLSDEIEALFQDTVSHSYTILSEIDTKLANDYLDLVDDICSIITECDDELSNSEKDLANYIRDEIEKVRK